jgi:hypothetical protein
METDNELNEELNELQAFLLADNDDDDDNLKLELIYQQELEAEKNKEKEIPKIKENEKEINNVNNLDFSKIKNFELINKIIKDYFEERACVNVLDKKDNDFQILIKFPNLTVPNTNGNTVNIEELLVSFKVRIFKNNESYNISFLDLSGTRTKWNEIHYGNNYHHSHLPSGTAIGFLSPFCIGNDYLNKIISIQKDVLFDDFVDYFIAFLMNIEDYVKWESLEGVPYFKMSNIKNSLKNFQKEKKEQLRSIINDFYVTNPLPNIKKSIKLYKIIFGENFLNNNLSIKILNNELMIDFKNVGVEKFLSFYLKLKNNNINYIDNQYEMMGVYFYNLDQKKTISSFIGIASFYEELLELKNLFH